MNPEYDVFLKLLDYGISVGLIVAVAWFLNKKNIKLEDKNNGLIEKMHHKDLENLKTLDAISRILGELKLENNENAKDIKFHVSERVKELKDDIRNYGK